MDDLQETAAVAGTFGEDSCEKTGVANVLGLGCETIHEDPVEQPAHILGVECLTDCPFSVSLLDHISHLLDCGFFNSFSALSNQDVACKQTPEHLQDEVRVALRLVNEDFFQAVQVLLGIYTKTQQKFRFYI